MDNNLNNQHMQEQEKEEENKGYFKYLFIFTILLFFCVFGITYSIYKGPSEGDDSEITTDQIIFTYSDVDKIGNGINIQDATPIPDSQGKVMVGKGQYFDFSITATTTNKKVFYQILVNKDDRSTLTNNKVRIYLTQMMGTYEKELNFKTFYDLRIRELNKKNYYILYENTLDENLTNYSESYRLRMWVKENAKDYQDKFFSVKIDVFAKQVEEGR